jgi:hypothetical protein
MKKDINPEKLMLNLLDDYFKRLNKMTDILNNVCLDLAVLSRDMSGTFHINKKRNKK